MVLLLALTTKIYQNFWRMTTLSTKFSNISIFLTDQKFEKPKILRYVMIRFIRNSPLSQKIVSA